MIVGVVSKTLERRSHRTEVRHVGREWNIADPETGRDVTAGVVAIFSFVIASSRPWCHHAIAIAALPCEVLLLTPLFSSFFSPFPNSS